MYFYERPDCITLSSNVDPYGLPSGIFLFKNFIPEELMLDLEKEIESQEYRDTLRYSSTLISWYANKMTPRPKRLLDFWELISELLYPTWVIHPSQSILNVRPGDGGMFCHSDSPGKGECHRLSQGDKFDTCCVLDYGLVAYFGNFTGGAVYYPMINPDSTPITNGIYGGECFEYQPERGDLIIHSAFDPYAHGVREVESGVRYAFSNFVLKAEDNPGTFYNYKTKEYYDQIGDRSEERIDNWMMPLIENPAFTDERIKIMQASGLEGVDLSNKFEDQLRKQDA
jgi:hypothetical protein